MKKSYRIIKTSFIKDLKYLSKGEHVEKLDLPPVNIRRIRTMEEGALKKMQEEAARIGVGVTTEAQEIFNALSKTYLMQFASCVTV